MNKKNQSEKEKLDEYAVSIWLMEDIEWDVDSVIFHTKTLTDMNFGIITNFAESVHIFWKFSHGTVTI